MRSFSELFRSKAKLYALINLKWTFYKMKSSFFKKVPALLKEFIEQFESDLFSYKLLINIGRVKPLPKELNYK